MNRQLRAWIMVKRGEREKAIRLRRTYNRDPRNTRRAPRRDHRNPTRRPRPRQKPARSYPRVRTPLEEARHPDPRLRTRAHDRRSPDPEALSLTRTPWLLPIRRMARTKEGWIDWDQVDLTRPTTELVEELQVSRQRICQVRQERGVPAPEPPRDPFFQEAFWDSLPLGKIPDTAIAEELGCSASTVRKARLLRGITTSPYSRRPHNVNWSSLPLGKINDCEIARRLQKKGHVVSIATVARNRRRLGIDACPPWRYAAR